MGILKKIKWEWYWHILPWIYNQFWLAREICRHLKSWATPWRLEKMVEQLNDRCGELYDELWNAEYQNDKLCEENFKLKNKRTVYYSRPKESLRTSLKLVSLQK